MTENTHPASQIKFLVLDVDGTLTDGGIYINEDGSQFKKFDVKDGMGIKLSIASGVDVGIISHSLVTAMVASRAHMLGIKYVYIGQEPKLRVLESWLRELGLTHHQVAYIGDDVNDLEIISKVGFTACPADAVDQVREAVNVRLTRGGGKGAVREFIDRYILNGKTEQTA